ncbi:MAG TPA: SUMF1/EgtB/PvdO family nonheme iron enzyme [Azospirillum sp.]|nr:SUMF1/EgtB/PvdO family nonheme iron enzyme [Azospirillum sp.]
MRREWLRGWLARAMAVLVLLAAGGVQAAGPAASSATPEEKRIALVIGISAYRNAPELVNPRNDAHAIAEVLRKLNFAVEEKQDLDIRGFADALRQFGINASQADVAVLYYAGHGIQVGGINYLIPSDARLERERDLVYEAMPLNLPMGELAQARKLGILILDACRNNPFVDKLTRTGGNRQQTHAGFTRVDDTPSDTLVAMATRADQLAEDGQGQHSPYTEALLKHLQTPGLELSLFFRNVRDTVKQATDGRQEPYIYGTLGATPFYFNPRPPNRQPVLAELRALEILDRAEAEPLRIGQPTDPDDDQLFARVTGLPRGGNVRIGERSVLIGDYLTVDQLAATSFKPDASFRGDAGGFEFTVMDGRGGTVRGVVPITIKPSNRPPLVVSDRTLRVVANPLGIEVPSDPDGDALTITVAGVPERGKVKSGASVVKAGDRLSADALTALVFDPERAPAGPAGAFSIVVEDGKGGRSTANVAVEIAEPGTLPVAELEQTVWERVRGSTDAADYEAFLRLFGRSGFAQMARQQVEKLAPPKDEAPKADAKADPPKADAKADVAEAGSSGGEALDTDAAAGTEVAMAGAPLEPVEGDAFTVVSDSNLRSAPNTSAARVGHVASGAPVRVLGRVPGANWLRIALEDGSQGFIFAPLVRPAPAQPQTQAQPQPRQEAASVPPRAPEPAPAPQPQPQEVAAAAPPPPGNGSAVRTHGRGNSFQDCPECPVMVRVPPGWFMMGNDRGDTAERPVHRVTIAKPFAMGAYEVTVSEWRACVDGGGCPNMPRMTNPTDNTPVYNVHWEDAQAYVKWLSQKTGQRYRLPSEAEWEYTARAGSVGPHWWDGEQGIFANCTNCGGPHERLTPAAAGSYKPNPFGLHDMNGGVAEWVADCWNKDYHGAPVDGSAWQEGNCRKRVLRGGSWRNALAEISATGRGTYDVDVRYINNGFRVARELN